MRPQRLTHHLATPPAVSSFGGLRTPAPCAPRHLHGAGIRKPSQERSFMEPYSITRSARATKASGITMPSALAVCILIDNSISVGCSTGMSAGLAPSSTFFT